MNEQIIAITASEEKWQGVAEKVEEMLMKIGFKMAEITMIQICVEEIFVNVAHYAYEGKEGMLEIKLQQIENEQTSGICIIFTDEGKPYNPLANKDPDITLDAMDRQIGGLGVFIVKNKMDEIDYRYENRHNIFSMTKWLSAGEK